MWKPILWTVFRAWTMNASTYENVAVAVEFFILARGQCCPCLLVLASAVPT